MDLLNLNYIKAILQLFQDKQKAKLIRSKRFLLKKTKHLINQMLKNLLTFTRKGFVNFYFNKFFDLFSASFLKTLNSITQ